MKELSKQRRGVFFLLLSAFLYSIMPVLIRILGKGGIPPISQVFLRYVFAFLSASMYFFIVSRAKININRKDVLTLLIITIFGYALTNLAFTYGILYTQVGNALFLFYSYAIIAPILGFFLLKDKINTTNIISLILSFISLVLLFQPNAFPTWKVGGFFAILAAVGQSVYLILRKKLSKIPASTMMLINTFVGVVVLAGLGLFFENKFYFQGGINQISTKTWIATMLFGIDNFLAWFTMTKGFEYFKATTGSIILLSELIFGIVFAFLFFSEIPTVVTLVGGVLILISASLVIIKGEN
ncbi:DMT family transporter [Candidatus Roizmanbacteria bacterium]|nr:DMT family transporter [Candidatus Roizmanbacteria bacterium]